MLGVDFGDEPGEIAPEVYLMKKKKIAKKAAKKKVSKAKRAKKKKLAKVSKTKALERINIKMKRDELKAIQAKADRYTDGNISAWLRKAGLGYVPKKA